MSGARDEQWLVLLGWQDQLKEEALTTDRLTQRERELTDLIRQGKSNTQIAAAMNLSQGSVKEYLSRIFTKLEIRNRTALAMWALKQ